MTTRFAYSVTSQRHDFAIMSQLIQRSCAHLLGNVGIPETGDLDILRHLGTEIGVGRLNGLEDAGDFTGGRVVLGDVEDGGTLQGGVFFWFSFWSSSESARAGRATALS